MTSSTALAIAVSLCSGCILHSSSSDDGPPPDAAAPPPPTCIQPEVRARQSVSVSGQVIDFASGAPVPGATVDVTTAWDVTGTIPRPECPLLATLTTDAEGRFGPVAVDAGSSQLPPIMLFMVHGGGRAPTASDNRACSEPTCNLGHTIAAPSTQDMAAMRDALAAGGMADAAARGLVAFRFKNPDQTGAADVTPQRGVGVVADLKPGSEVRFLDIDRRTVMPAAQAATSASGMALVGLADPENAIYVGGRRTTQRWISTGCLVMPGWLFLEDRTVSP